MLRRVLLALALLWPALPASAQQDPSFNLVNRTGEVINEIYVSSVQVNAWGNDLLGANVLPAGQSFAVRLPNGQCRNDIRVVYAGGRAEERRDLDTCPLSEVVFGGQQAGPAPGGKGAPTAAATPGGNPSFNLVNRTAKTIQVVRASLASESNWGEDRLGTAVIPPGGSFAIRLPQGDCVYDVRIEYADNSAEERRRVNLCEISTMTFP